MILYWLARNATIQRTGESFEVQGLTFTTHLSPSFTWASNHRGGWVWGFSWHQICGTCRPVSIDLGYHICGVSADAKVEVSRLPRLQMPAMCSRVIMFLNNWLKLKISTLPPCSKAQSNQWTNSGKLLFTVLRVTYRKKLRNSEMEEIFRSWV